MPNEWTADPGDLLDQSEIIDGIIGTAVYDDPTKERFESTRLSKVRLSRLRDAYERQKRDIVDVLATRHTVKIDKDYCIPLATDPVIFNTDETMIDYHLTVANCIGLSSLLPNARSAHRFTFDLDLKRPHISFKGKHAMLGFDPAGSMLSLGTCNNEDIFLAMAPNEFLCGRTQPSPPGHSSASPLMSRRHYRQMVMLFAHFLDQVATCSFYNMEDVYKQDLTSPAPNFGNITTIMYVVSIVPSLSATLLFYSTISYTHPIPTGTTDA